MNNTIGARPPLRLLAAVALVAVAGCATQTPRNTALSAIDETLAPPTERKAMPVVPPAVREELVRAMPIAPPESWLPEVRFDLAVSNAPAAQVFLAIASDSRYSMLLPPDLPGTITINLKDVTVREALDALRELYGYEYRIDGKRVYVMPQGLQTRIFRINYLDIRRQGQSEIRVSSGSLTSAPPSAQSPGAPITSLPSGGSSTPGGQAACERDQSARHPKRLRFLGRARRVAAARSSAPRAAATWFSTRWPASSSCARPRRSIGRSQNSCARCRCRSSAR